MPIHTHIDSGRKLDKGHVFFFHVFYRLFPRRTDCPAVLSTRPKRPNQPVLGHRNKHSFSIVGVSLGVSRSCLKFRVDPVSCSCHSGNQRESLFPAGVADILCFALLLSFRPSVLDSTCISAVRRPCRRRRRRRRRRLIDAVRRQMARECLLLGNYEVGLVGYVDAWSTTSRPPWTRGGPRVGSGGSVHGRQRDQEAGISATTKTLRHASCTCQSNDVFLERFVWWAKSHSSFTVLFFLAPHTLGTCGHVEVDLFVHTSDLSKWG